MILTREERAKVVRKLRESVAPLEPSWEQESEALCQVQLRRIAEWLERHEDKEGYKAIFYFCISRRLYEQLRKEAGLE